MKQREFINKMSDGGRNRASLGLEVWKSSQKWAAQRSAVRSIAWLDTLGKTFSRIDRYGMPLLLIRKISAPLNHSSKGKPKSNRICITVVLVFEVARLSIRRGKSKPTGMSE